MHIPDGFLSVGVSVATGVVSAGVIGYGMVKARKELDEKTVPLLALCTAFVFAAQMLNFPVAGGTSGHFLGGVMVAVILGPLMGSLVISTVAMPVKKIVLISRPRINRSKRTARGDHLLQPVFQPRSVSLPDSLVLILRGRFLRPAAGVAAP